METFNTNEKSLLRIAEALEKFSAEKIGDLTNLDTEAKDNLVAAINEVASAIVAPSRFPNGMILEIDNTWLERELTEEELNTIKEVMIMIRTSNGGSLSLSYMNTCPSAKLLSHTVTSIKNKLKEGQEFYAIEGYWLNTQEWAEVDDELIIDALEALVIVNYTEGGETKYKLFMDTI